MSTEPKFIVLPFRRARNRLVLGDIRQTTSLASAIGWLVRWPIGSAARGLMRSRWKMKAGRCTSLGLSVPMARRST